MRFCISEIWSSDCFYVLWQKVSWSKSSAVYGLACDVHKMCTVAYASHKIFLSFEHEAIPFCSPKITLLQSQLHYLKEFHPFEKYHKQFELVLVHCHSLNEQGQPNHNVQYLLVIIDSGHNSYLFTNSIICCYIYYHGKMWFFEKFLSAVNGSEVLNGILFVWLSSLKCLQKEDNKLIIKKFHY